MCIRDSATHGPGQSVSLLHGRRARLNQDPARCAYGQRLRVAPTGSAAGARLAPSAEGLGA
eukprot:9100980-Lingulodinium_polyedra.AAC.1